MLESFSRADSEFAKAVCIWRDNAVSEQAVWQDGGRFLRELLQGGVPSKSATEN